METELGNPIEYSPELPRKEDPIHNEEMEAPYYLPHPSMMMQPPPMTVSYTHLTLPTSDLV